MLCISLWNKSCNERKTFLLRSNVNIRTSRKRGALGYIDLILWLESKITNRQFSDVVKDKLITVMQNEIEVTLHKAKLPL